MPGAISHVHLLGPLALSDIHYERHTSFPPTSKRAAPTSTGTQLLFFRKYSFSNGWIAPVAFASAIARSSRSRHSAGVR